MLKTDLIGQSLCLVLVTETGPGEDDCAVFPGIVRVDGDTLFLDRGENGPRFELHDEWLPRVRTVEPDVAKILRDASYVLMLTVGNYDEQPDRDKLRDTGLRWPK